MKKITFLIVLMLFAITGSFAQISYTYGWEDEEDGGWVFDSGTSGDFDLNYATPCTGEVSVRGNAYNGNQSILMSPSLGTSNAGEITLQFNYKVLQWSFDVETEPAESEAVLIEVQWASTANGPWTTVQTIDNHIESVNCIQKTVTFTPGAGDLFVRFVNTGVESEDINDDITYYYDDINVTQGVSPPCVAPTGLLISELTKNSATVSWTASITTPANGYLYYRSETNTPPLDDTEETGSVLAGETSVDLSTLMPNTTYYVWVRSDCDADGLSDWMGPLVFSTMCDYADILTTTGGAVCGQGTPELSATIGAGGILNWYAAETGGARLGTGETFTTPLITQDTNFYVSGGSVIEGIDANVGEGESTSSSAGYTPYYHYYGAYKLQFIIKASELQAANISAGPINSIAYTVTYAGEDAYNDFAISIGTTEENEATESHIDGLTPVYSNASQSVTEGLNVYTFDTPFEWDGTSNIVVQTCYSNENAGGESSEVEYDSLDFDSCTYSYADNVTADAICSLVTGQIEEDNGGTDFSNKRPKVTFNASALCEGPRVAVLGSIETPPVLTLSTESISICNGDTIETVSIEGTSDYDTYVWTPSTGVSGDSTTGWVFTPTRSTLYTLTASQSDGVCTTTIPLQITINYPPSIAITPTSTSICGGSTQLLTAESVAKVTMGTGNNAPDTTSYPNPFSAWYGGVKTQMLYTEEELLAKGLVIGSDIISLSFDFEASEAKKCHDLRIKIGPTTNVEMTDGFVASSGLTTVYNASYTPVAGTTGLVSFPLTTNYIYQGGNLIVEVAHNQGNGGNGSGTRNRASTTSFTSVYSAATDNVEPAGVASYDALSEDDLGNTNSFNTRPNVVFELSGEFSVVWSPMEELFIDEAATIPYAGENIVSVYAKPAVDASFTVTATNPAGCVITKTANIVMKNTLPPTVAAETQTLCGSATVANLVAVGTVIKWYEAEAGGVVLLPTTPLEDGKTYYASQRVAGCESVLRTPLTVSLEVVDAPTVADDAQGFCNAGTVADLLPNDASIKWYSASTGGTALVSTQALVNGEYFASQTVEGCESVTRTLVTVTLNSTAKPEGSATQTICGPATVGDLDATGDTIVWYDAETEGNVLANDAALVSGNSYYASQSIDGCESLERLTVTVTLTVVPAPDGDDTQVFEVETATESVTIDDLEADLETGGTITWYNTLDDALAGENPIAAGTEVTEGEDYFGIQTIGDCSSATAFKVTIDIVLGRDTFNLNAFTYHPNPVKDILNVSYTSDITSISVFNILGQQVIAKQPNAAEVKLDMSSLADGAYIVNVTAGSAVKTIKVIKRQ